MMEVVSYETYADMDERRLLAESKLKASEAKMEKLEVVKVLLKAMDKAVKIKGHIKINFDSGIHRRIEELLKEDTE